MTIKGAFYDHKATTKKACFIYGPKKHGTKLRPMANPSFKVVLRDDTNARLTSAAIKLRCSRSAVVEALIRIACGLPVDDPIAEWFTQRGVKPVAVNFESISESEASAPRPRGSHLKNKKDRTSASIHRGAAARIMALPKEVRDAMWPEEKKRQETRKKAPAKADAGKDGAKRDSAKKSA